MNETLSEIRKYISQGSFINEESVRLSLVARVLIELGWDIWNPNEVKPEHKVTPREDAKRVDIALFDKQNAPSVLIEVKAMDKLNKELSKHEYQLRDYNKDMTATISIITDGRNWRFYASQTAGEFSQKCFEVLDLVKDDIEDIELSFITFLSKEEIHSERAKDEAQKKLQRSHEERAMEDALPKARRLTEKDPFPSWPEALVEVLKKEAGITKSLDEAKRYVKKKTTSKPEPKSSKIEFSKDTELPIPIRKTPRSRFYRGKRISSIVFDNKDYDVRYWIDALTTICDILVKTKGEDFERVLQISGINRPYFAKDSILLRHPRQIKNTEIFVETNFNANQIGNLCYEIIFLFGYSESDLEYQLIDGN